MSDHIEELKPTIDPLEMLESGMTQEEKDAVEDSAKRYISMARVVEAHYQVKQIKRRFHLQRIGDFLQSGLSYVTTAVLYIILGTIGVFALWGLNFGFNLLLQLWGVR